MQRRIHFTFAGKRSRSHIYEQILRRQAAELQVGRVLAWDCILEYKIGRFAHGDDRILASGCGFEVWIIEIVILIATIISSKLVHFEIIRARSFSLVHRFAFLSDHTQIVHAIFVGIGLAWYAIDGATVLFHGIIKFYPKFDDIFFKFELIWRKRRDYLMVCGWALALFSRYVRSL